MYKGSKITNKSYSTCITSNNIKHLCTKYRSNLYKCFEKIFAVRFINYYCFLIEFSKHTIFFPTCSIVDIGTLRTLAAVVDAALVL